MPTELGGGCHCRAVAVSLTLSREPAEIEVRACQCGFCRRHGARTIADPDGMLTITAEPGALKPYRFGLRTADFLLCADCGCYIAAVVEVAGGQRATLNTAGVGLADFAGHDPRPVRYDGEDAAARTSRRMRNWMPVDIVDGRRAVAV